MLRKLILMPFKINQKIACGLCVVARTLPQFKLVSSTPDKYDKAREFVGRKISGPNTDVSSRCP